MKFALISAAVVIVAIKAIFETSSQILNLLFITISKKRHILQYVVCSIFTVLALLVVLK